LVHFIKNQEPNLGADKPARGSEESVQLLRGTADNMGHILLQKSQFWGKVACGESRANTKGRPYTNRTTNVAYHALGLCSLIDSRGDHNHDGSDVRGPARRVHQSHMDCRDHIRGDTLLRWRRLRNNIGTFEQKWQGTLLNLIWWSHAKFRQGIE
jgi:hypothetical protein